MVRISDLRLAPSEADLSRANGAKSPDWSAEAARTIDDGSTGAGTARFRVLNRVDRENVVATIAAAIVFVATLMALASFVDRKELQREQVQVQRAVAERLDALSSQIPVQLDWDEAVRNLDNKFDLAWSDENVGHYFCQTLHFDYVFVIGADGQVPYGMRGADRIGLEAFNKAKSSYAQLIAAVRAQEARRGSFRPPFDLSKGDISRPIQAVGLVREADEIFAVTATLVQPSSGEYLPRSDRAPIVLTGKRLGNDFLKSISDGLQIQNVRFGTSERADDGTFALLDVQGAQIGALTWEATRPGRELILFASLPLLLALSLLVWLYQRGRRAAQKFRAAAKEIDDITASVPGAIFSLVRELDGSVRFAFVSPAIEALTGARPSDLLSSTKDILSRIFPADKKVLLRHFARAAARVAPFNGEARVCHPAVGERWIGFHSSPRSSDGGRIVWYGFAADITERKRGEATLRNAAAVLTNTGEEVIVTDLKGNITLVNPAFVAKTGFILDEVLGQSIAAIDPDVYESKELPSMLETAAKKGTWQGEFWTRTRQGERQPKWVTLSAVQDELGKAVGFVATLTDISQLKATESRLEHLANHDSLTGLPNRMAMQNRLGQILERARLTQMSGAVMFLDLDRFKTINDSMGHSVGDELLRTVSSRLAGRLRSTDVLARVGGDEFIVILEHVDSVEKVGNIAATLIEEILKPVTVGDRHELFIGSSIGISFFPKDGTTAEELIKNADAALYHAKDQGRNTYRFFNDSLTQFATARLDMEMRLRRAIERCELEVFYQPIVSLSDQRVTSVEALVRWHDPDNGLLMPNMFIPLAEETGLILPLGEWVLLTACRQMKEWRDRGLDGVSVAVNLSPVQFRQHDLVDRIRHALALSGLPPDALELEITEGALMQSIDETEVKLKALRLEGVRISVDDFGTGHSSLEYLKRLSVNAMKIDKGFIDGLISSSADESIVVALIFLAHSLSFDCVAEGIETDAQLDFLKREGCKLGQGFLFAEPLAASDIEPSLFPVAGSRHNRVGGTRA